MLLLGVDTSGRQGGLALARGSADSFEVLEVVLLAGGSYSARFIPELSALLERHQANKHGLEGFAVVSGPGSFTGLRVGLSAVKGLAEVLQRPIAAVSMLEALAARASYSVRAITAFDAGRKELFVGEYDVRGGEPILVSESLMSHQQFSALLDANSGAELITTDMSVAELAGMHLHVKQTDWPDAGEIARLGFNKLKAGQTVAPEVLEANYIRRSDAEIFAKNSH
jgi:tRNA threonylcarbamoyladenosine biosynthesis protein TsaB